MKKNTNQKMKKLISTFLYIFLFAMFAMPLKAQPISGESAPFVFNTQSMPTVSVSPWVVVCVFLLAFTIFAYRYLKNKYTLS